MGNRSQISDPFQRFVYRGSTASAAMRRKAVQSQSIFGAST
jgi:hypothetical protein